MEEKAWRLMQYNSAVILVYLLIHMKITMELHYIRTEFSAKLLCKHSPNILQLRQFTAPRCSKDKAWDCFSKLIRAFTAEEFNMK